MKYNKLIAQYMGGKVLQLESVSMPHGSEKEVDIESWSVPNEIPQRDYDSSKMGFFRYHNSWDWLIPVIQKIEKDFNVSILKDCPVPLTIECTYETVGEFIENNLKM